MPLSDTSVRQAKPQKKAYKRADGKGLYLYVQPSSSKYWRFKYRIAGKEKLLALGTYPDVSLARARDKRDEARRLLADGIDPAKAKKDRKRLKRLQAANSFEAVAREWHTQQEESWTPKHAATVLRSLDKELFPALGSQPIAEITAAEVLEVIKKVEKRGALDVASRLLQRTNSIFRYAVRTGRAPHNPAADLTGALKTRKTKHRKALGRGDLPEFLRKLEAYSGEVTTRLALELTLLTFVRSSELRGARWSEFDLARAEWRIPAERMKMRAPHIVPLASQTVAVLEELKPLTGRYDLVFPGQNDKTKPISLNTLIFAMYRLGYHSRATVHGFRATASTILNEMGWRPDVIERQLAHVERNKSRAAYHRSEYLEERRQMMQAWADYLDELRSGAQIVPIHRAS
jgi:integrase